MFHSPRSLLAMVVAASACSPLTAHATAAGKLVPHRAVYDVQLKEASERSGIEGMRGRMVYEFRGSACDGFSTDFRFVTQINTGEGTRVTDQRSSTFEDVEAGTFSFSTKTFTDDQLDTDISGAAREQGGKVKVELTGPSNREVEVAASRFPAEHMLEVISRAQRGERFFESRIYDGSEEGDQTYLTTTIVGPRQKPGALDGETKAVGELLKAEYWPVSISYFEENTVGDQLPIYSQSFKLYENGVTRDLTLDYGDFVLTGKLTKLEILGASADTNCQP
ncbi:cell envelope integrity EipB family protein [Peteryoungia desertarenae]|uniref:Cell envelope integrity EipB family protein n=1 Tax=Peteryoungia desertarenae TaxID=1813451 RepID=A0ABX6QPC3_9HYPH|nr:cell envelope integrity EipB family protein [Peteryoungia desertarenae]QLF70344.1 cell envelope integrity EipB family protein [Peteryoungia desertarenae]